MRVELTFVLAVIATVTADRPVSKKTGSVDSAKADDDEYYDYYADLVGLDSPQPQTSTRFHASPPPPAEISVIRSIKPVCGEALCAK